MENVKDIIENVSENAHSEMTAEQMVEQAIIQSDPNVILRNLAYWLDIAIAKGRHVDFIEQQAIMEQQNKENGMSSSDNNSQSEV